jgi:Mn-containing catalase
VARLYEMTTDSGIRDLLSFLLARDTMHQNQWLAAIQELEADGLEMTPCPSSFPQDREFTEVSYQFMNFSPNGDSAQGRWAAGPSIDGQAEFQYVSEPVALGDVPELGPGDPQLYGTTPASQIRTHATQPR